VEPPQRSGENCLTGVVAGVVVEALPGGLERFERHAGTDQVHPHRTGGA